MPHYEKVLKACEMVWFVPIAEETLARDLRACKYIERAIDVLQGAVEL